MRWHRHYAFVAWIVVTLLAPALLSLSTRVHGAAPDDEEWKAPARAARKKNPIAADDKSIAAGKVVYVKECLSCHGEKGKGDGPAAKDLTKPPGDLSNSHMWHHTDGDLFWKITEGRKPMPTFEKLLSEEQRWNAVNYTRTLAPKPSSTQPSTQPATQPPQEGGHS